MGRMEYTGKQVDKETSIQVDKMDFFYPVYLYTCLPVYLISFPQEPAMLFSPSLPHTLETATFAFG